MRIGYACNTLGIDKRTSRKFILKNFNLENFHKATSGNLSDLEDILEYNIKNNIFLFRISSDIIPFGSHLINNINWQREYKNTLKGIGKYIKSNNIRVSMHPGQYTVLNSPNFEVVKNAVSDLEYHCNFLDSLDLDYQHRIELHIGGVYGNKSEAIGRFLENFNLLSPSLKNRLSIENDDRSYNIKDILDISKYLSIPPIFDNLHNLINPSIEDNFEILSLVRETTKKEFGPILLHYSEQNINKKKGSHSETIDVSILDNYINSIKVKDFDMILEVKDKDLSVIKYLNEKAKG